MVPMPNNKKPKSGRKLRRRSKTLIVIGSVLILAAASLTLYNVWDSDRAGRVSAAIEEQLDAAIEANAQAATDHCTVSDDREMHTVTLDGVRYIGTITIPAAELVLPVRYDYTFEALKNSPCRYYGSYLTNDLVICAHNSRKHFGPIRYLMAGDDIYLRTVDGDQIHYVVLGLETIQPDEIDRMISTENEKFGKWDLTMFTCYVGGQTRCAVRCARADN